MSDETNEHEPNYVVSKQEACGMRLVPIMYYPEDVEKLRKLEVVSGREYTEYVKALRQAGRYIVTCENDEETQWKWRKVLSACGIALRKKIVDGVDWTYTVKDGAACIGDGLGVAIPPSTTGEITIPLTLDGCPVTRIGDMAFSGCRGLTGVKIPDSVTSIGDGAFGECQGLTTVTIPANVARIGNRMFSCCSSLASLTIPDGVTYVGNEAFSHCSALTSVTIPASVSFVGGYAFLDCIRLKSVTMLGDVAKMRIGEKAFDGCPLRQGREHS